VKTLRHRKRRVKHTAKQSRGRRNGRVRIGGDDASVTGAAGLVLVAEVDLGCPEESGQRIWL